MNKRLVALLLVPVMHLCALEFQGVTIKDRDTFARATQGDYLWDLDYGTAHGVKWKKAELKLCPTMQMTIKGLARTDFVKGEQAGDPTKYVFDKIEGNQVHLHYAPLPVASGEAPEIPCKIIFTFDGSVMIITTIRDLPAESRQVREIREYWRLK